MKLLTSKESIPCVGVAPLAGAWIETLCKNSFVSLSKVAPLAGAWIETLLSRICKKNVQSLPSRERGLKQAADVQPNGGAESLPSRERGLKQTVV